MKKLTDEELSRVLSQQAIGKLIHDVFGEQFSEDYPWSECGCIAGAALEMGNISTSELPANDAARAWEISCAVGDEDYPRSPERMLAFLAARGLA